MSSKLNQLQQQVKDLTAINDKLQKQCNSISNAYANLYNNTRQAILALQKSMNASESIVAYDFNTFPPAPPIPNVPDPNKAKDGMQLATSGAFARALNQPMPNKKFLNSKPMSEEKLPPRLGKGFLKVLHAIAAFYPGSANRDQVAIISNFDKDHSTFRAYIAELKNRQYILVNADKYICTPIGITAAGEFISLTTCSPKEKLFYWTDHIGSNNGASRILTTLFNKYPKNLTIIQLEKIIHVDSDDSTFRKFMATLRKCELINETDGKITLAAHFFQKELRM